MIPPFDAGPWVRRARRLTGLSQRAYARKAELSESALARIETGEVDPKLGVLVRLLSVAGFTLVAVTEDGEVLVPFDVDGVRDLGGRRYPAHKQVFRLMRGEFADYFWSWSTDPFFATQPEDDRTKPPQGVRRPRPRVRRKGYGS